MRFFSRTLTISEFIIIDAHKEKEYFSRSLREGAIFRIQ